MGRPYDCNCWCPDGGGGGDPDFFGCCNPNSPTAFWTKVNEDDDWEYRVDFYENSDPSSEQIYPEIVFTHSGESYFSNGHFQNHLDTIYVRNILDDLSCGTFSETEFLNTFKRTEPIADLEPYNRWYYYGCFGIEASSGTESHFYVPSGWYIYHDPDRYSTTFPPPDVELQQFSSPNSISIITASGGGYEYRNPRYNEYVSYYSYWYHNRYYRGASTCPDTDTTYNINGSGSWPRWAAGYMPSFYKKWNNPQAHSLYYVVSGIANTYEKSSFDIVATLHSRMSIDPDHYWWNLRRDTRNYNLFQNDGFGCCCDNYVLQFNSGVIDIPEENLSCSSGCLEMEINSFYRRGFYHSNYIHWNRSAHMATPNWGVKFFESESEYQSYLNGLDLISIYDAVHPVGQSGELQLQNSILRSDLRNLSGVPTLTCLNGTEADNLNNFSYPYSISNTEIAERINLNGFTYDGYDYSLSPSGADTNCQARMFQLGLANKDPSGPNYPYSSGILEGTTLIPNISFMEYELESNYCGGNSACDYTVHLDVQWDTSGKITSLNVSDSGNYSTAMIYVYASQDRFYDFIDDCPRFASGDPDFYSWSWADIPRPSQFLVSGDSSSASWSFYRRNGNDIPDNIFSFIDTVSGYSNLSDFDAVRFDPVFSTFGSGLITNCGDDFSVDSGREANLFITFDQREATKYYRASYKNYWSIRLSSPLNCSDWHNLSYWDYLSGYSSFCPDWYDGRVSDSDDRTPKEKYCKKCEDKYNYYNRTHTSQLKAYQFSLSPKNVLLLHQFWNNIRLLAINEMSLNNRTGASYSASIYDDVCLADLRQSLFTELMLNLGANPVGLDLDNQDGQVFPSPNFGKYFFMPDQPGENITTLAKYYSPTCSCRSDPGINITKLVGTLEDIDGCVSYWSIQELKGIDRFTGEEREVGQPCNSCNFHCGAGSFYNCSDGERDSVYLAVLCPPSFSEDDIGEEFTIINPTIDCSNSYLYNGWAVPSIESKNSFTSTPEECQG